MHQKHVHLTKPKLGNFSRNELAIMGTNCGAIRQLASTICHALAPQWKTAYVDADHKNPTADNEKSITLAADVEFTDKITHRRLEYKQDFDAFAYRAFLNNQDLTLVNGNHYSAKAQVLVIDPAKSLDKKLDKLTDVRFIILSEPDIEIPEVVRERLPYFDQVPVYTSAEFELLVKAIDAYLVAQTPQLNGLVLAGGQSTRMQQDKGSINYHGTSQRAHLANLLQNTCEQVFVSCNQPQPSEQLHTIADTFTDLGPMGGILSAFRQNPTCAWLAVACDMPYLTAETIAFLVRHRDPSKVATAFKDPAGEFPEPLLTIWEPRSYAVLLQFLAQGYTCPRKVLINSDVALVQAPDVQELQNINLPQERIVAMQTLKSRTEQKCNV